jgi:hypothetical protein
MKNIKFLLLAMAITFSSLLSANTENSDKNTPELIAAKIGKLLEKPNFIIDQDITANVVITLNKNNEIVVLSVETENILLAPYIKSRLNYQSVPVNMNLKEKIFVVPVRITAAAQ